MSTNTETRDRPHVRLLRRATAIFLMLHALAHLVGVQAAAEALNEGGTLAYVGGRWDASGPWLVVLAAGWILAASAFVLTGWALWRDWTAWAYLLLAVSAGSLLLSLAALPEAAVGVAINLVLVAIAAGAALHNRTSPRPSAARRQDPPFVAG